MRINIMDVARLLGLGIKHGTEYRTEVEAMCPFCDDDKSYHLSLNTKKNVFRCNRCGRFGGMLHLYAFIHNTTTKEAYDAIVEDLNQNRHVPVQNKISAGVNFRNTSPLPEKVCHEVRPVRDRDKVYRVFLNMLVLSDIHRHNLKKRGLPSGIISANGYKSVTFQPEARLEIGRKMAAEHDLRGIPGFYTNREGQWDFFSKSGILIPVRNKDGLIQGLQIRLDDVSERKYRWFSSNNFDNGTRAGTWVHFTGTPGKEDVYLTEGALKADIASYFLRGRYFIAVPGINCTQYLGATLQEAGVGKVLEAFDMDKLSKPEVIDAVKKIREVVESTGLEYQGVRWDVRYKGLDDYLYHKVAEQA